MTFDIELEFAADLARTAATSAKSKRDHGFKVSFKGPNDLVTDIDRETEQLVADAIASAFPDDSMLGEEHGGAQEATGRRWIVDPIDGTMNFVQGIPFFCISVALEVDGVVEVGAIYDANQDELFSGTRATGSMLNGKPTHVSDVAAVSDAVFATGFVTSKSSITLDENLAKFCTMVKSSRGMRRLGSAALDLAYVSCGRLDGFWEYDLSPWDVAAGGFLVELAGGRVSTAVGGPHDLNAESILGTNFVLHDDVVALLRTA